MGNTDCHLVRRHSFFALPFPESRLNADFDLEHECCLVVNDKLLRWVFSFLFFVNNGLVY